MRNFLKVLAFPLQRITFAISSTYIFPRRTIHSHVTLGHGVFFFFNSQSPLHMNTAFFLFFIYLMQLVLSRYPAWKLNLVCFLLTFD